MPSMFEYRRGPDGIEVLCGVERRAVDPVAVDTTDDGVVVRGTAIAYGVPYGVLGGPPLGWTETMRPGAARKSAREADVRMLVSHDGLPVARVRSGTLRLDDDDAGLRFEATLDPTNPRVTDLLSGLRRGDVTEMSVGFRAIRQQWSDDYTRRDLVEIALVEISPVAIPANPATSIQLVTRAGMHTTLARAVVASLRLRHRSPNRD